MRPLVLLLLLAGCGREDAVGFEAIPGVQVRMDFARAELYDAPFPSDDLRSGTVDVSGFPNPDGIPYLEDVQGLLQEAEGFGTTSGIFFALDGPVDATPWTPWTTSEDAAAVSLVDVDPQSPERGRRVPLTVDFQADGGPFGAENLLSLLPVQGIVLRPGTRYAAVIRRDLGDAEGAPLGVSRDMVALARGVSEALDAEDQEAYRQTLGFLETVGVPRDEVAGLAVFTTQDPVAEFASFVAHAREQPTPAPLEGLALTEVFDGYCVYEGAVHMPDYQQGEPPFDTEGGWTTDGSGTPVVQRQAVSRLWLTVPREPTPAEGWPVAVMIRTGGGGDVPLVERGVRDASGAAEPGTGPAMHFADLGWAGLTVDGPHGGARNPTGANEQFIMFNVGNPMATRDNVRQSALEIALLPDVLEGLQFEVDDCPGASGVFEARSDGLVLMGHSMGATIAPLSLAVEPRYEALILSGAGGSYIHNLVHKQSPLPVRPVAEAILNYPTRGRELHAHDPFLSLLQWGAESSDPPVYAASIAPDAEILMLQGIVDTYILPPMANATSLSMGLDLAGPSLDVDHPDLQDFTPLGDLLPLVGGREVPLPVSEAVRVVIQHAEGPIEDGHEVMFQTESPTRQYRCLLATLLKADRVVPDHGSLEEPCF